MAPFDLQTPAGSSVRVPRFIMVALRAWRGSTFRMWAWTTVFALILALAHQIGILPIVLHIFGTPERGPPRPASFSAVLPAGVLIVYLAAGYCLLLAITIAEYGFS